MSLAPALRSELEAVAPELLAHSPAMAEHYGEIAEAAARSRGVAAAMPLRVAAAATLLEWALTAHGAAPEVDPETLLTADLRLAIAAEIAAEVREPRIQAALSAAIMRLAVGIAERPHGLAENPRHALGELVAASALLVERA